MEASALTAFAYVRGAGRAQLEGDDTVSRGREDLFPSITTLPFSNSLPSSGTPWVLLLSTLGNERFRADAPQTAPTRHSFLGESRAERVARLANCSATCRAELQPVSSPFTPLHPLHPSSCARSPPGCPSSSTRALPLSLPGFPRPPPDGPTSLASAPMTPMPHACLDPLGHDGDNGLQPLPGGGK